MFWFKKKESQQESLQRKKNENFKIVLFSLDGVIINSLDDIVDAVNATLRYFSFPAISSEKIRPFIGHGTKALILRAISESTRVSARVFSINDLNSVLDFYKQYYYDNAVNKTVLYDGVLEALESLYSMGIYMGCVSNKSLPMAESILEKFDLSLFFDSIVCPEHVICAKPDKEGLHLAIRQICEIRKEKIFPMQTIMVGDCSIDIQAARNAGCASCGFLGGYGDRKLLFEQNPRWTITHITQLLKLI